MFSNIFLNWLRFYYVWNLWGPQCSSIQCLSGSFSLALFFLFSSSLSPLIPPLVQSHYWHVCQRSAENAVSNTSNQQFPSFFSAFSCPLFLSFPLQTMPGLNRQCTAVISPPTPSLDSSSTNICCIQSGFGHGAEGVDAEVKTRS